MGSALEYFDFAVYGALSATVFPKLFFSGLGDTGSLLASFATFGVGFAARPVGALVFGHLGDRLGRKPILFTTLLIMGGSSLLIGLLPTGMGAGVAALLVILRFLQGVSLGGEATGNQLMTMEHGDPKRRGLLGAFVNVGAPIGQVAANLVLAVLTASLSQAQWESWGWRAPFLASILLVGVTLFLRVKVDETPVFVADRSTLETSESHSETGLRVLSAQWRQVLQLALGWGGPSLGFYLMAIFGLHYLQENVGLSTGTTFVIFTIANAVSAAFTFTGGWVSDQIGRKRSVLISFTAATAGMTLFFTLASSVSVPVLTVIIGFSFSSIQFGTGIQPALFAEQFPTRFRFAGSAMSFTLANLLFSAPGPFLAAAIFAAGGVRYVMWMGIGVMAVSFLAICTIKDRSRADLAPLSLSGNTAR
ncbi:MFS transporter [Streptomyces sp. NPDC056983]|uniref:MFS transporter n=1 Tax=Streptomyces sp. NPDC056983 TaxID=3345987 RepID=UPI0036386663